jgi:hypothetical protein
MTDNSDDDSILQVLDVSVNRLCWIVTCPFFHCGFCPYQTGTYLLLSLFGKQQSGSDFGLAHVCPSHTQKVLYLREHDVERHDRNLCGSRSSTRPYQQLGSGHGGGGVVVSSCCCCLVCADSALGTILPGSGCDRDAVNIIAQTLRERQQQNHHNSSGNRWHTASDQLADRTEALERKMDVILDHLLVLAATKRNTEQPLPAVEAGPVFAMAMSER